MANKSIEKKEEKTIKAKNKLVDFDLDFILDFKFIIGILQTP